MSSSTGQAFRVLGGGNLSGTQVDIVPAASNHEGYGFQYQTAVNINAFSASFTWVPNGYNLALTLNNQTTNPGYNGASFYSGAGCEGGFYQAFGVAANNVFALELDSYSTLGSGGNFSYSSVQIYQQNQSPCNPNDSASGYWSTTKFSTLPVPLNSPSGTQGTTTGDTYSVSLTYDGSNLVVNMYDVTAGGSCPGAGCYTNTWSNVAIPALVAANTAYVGFTSGVGLQTTFPLYIDGFSYTQNSPTAIPGTSAPVAGGSPAANPTFLPSPGTYSGAQLVSISDITSGSNICYILGSPGLRITPLPNNIGGCAVGSVYSGPVSVPSSQTLYATAGTNAVNLPSGVSQGAYVIGGSGTGTVSIGGKAVVGGKVVIP